MHQNIILIGFMGCGKTTLGRQIARKLHLPFMDVDEEIEKLLGMTISEIFATHGEYHFRQIERTWLMHLSPNFNGVVSVGGGLPCFKDNIALLRKLGFVIYLERKPKELFQRLINAKAQRPLLEAMHEDELLAYIENKIRERENYYNQADWIPKREEQTVQIVSEKIQELRSKG